MTDDRPTTVRCRQCGVIYPNTPLDKGYHRENCVYDLRLRIQALEDENAGLKALKDRVDSTVSSLPIVGADVPFDDEDDEEEPMQESQYVHDVTPSATWPVGTVDSSGTVHTEDEDEWDDEPSTASPIR